MRRVPAADAIAALEHPALAMPTDELPPGQARDIRRSMARFSDGGAHHTARAAVEAEIAHLDIDEVVAIATRRATHAMQQRSAAQVAALAPAAAVAEALGILDAADDGQNLVADLETVGDAAVTGVVDDDGATANAAAAALIAHVDSVARISVLHQTRAATASLIDGLLTAGRDRPPAVGATKRTAHEPADIHGLGHVSKGETITIELDHRSEFGAGVHECPGRDLALALGTAIADVLRG